MTKESYLQSLETLLKKHLSKSEINDILRDYGEYFDDGRRQNKTDTEISAKLGDPEIIAQQFIEEIGNESKIGSENKTEKAIHTIKEGTGKAFSTIKESTEKAFISLKKESKKKNQSETPKESNHTVQKCTKSIFSVIKSICLFCIFALLQFFFTIFIYGFCITAALFLISCAIFGLFCLGVCLSLFPPVLSLSLAFAIIATLALAVLFGLLLVHIGKANIRLIRHYLKRHRNKREVF